MYRRKNHYENWIQYKKKDILNGLGITEMLLDGDIDVVKPKGGSIKI